MRLMNEIDQTYPSPIDEFIDMNKKHNDNPKM